MSIRARFHRTALRASVMGLTVTLLSACAQPVPPRVCPPSAPLASSGEVRMMISFRQPTAGDAPDVLLQLQRHAGGCVSYLSSVSPTVHVYAISGGNDAAALRLNLRSMPAVLDAVPDEKAKAHKLH